MKCVRSWKKESCFQSLNQKYWAGRSQIFCFYFFPMYIFCTFEARFVQNSFVILQLIAMFWSLPLETLGLVRWPETWLVFCGPMHIINGPCYWGVYCYITIDQIGRCCLKEKTMYAIMLLCIRDTKQLYYG